MEEEEEVKSGGDYQEGNRNSTGANSSIASENVSPAINALRSHLFKWYNKEDLAKIKDEDIPNLYKYVREGE